MAFNWKTTAFVLIDCALAVYLVLAVTAFNRPDEADDICNEVNIKVEDGSVKGFLDNEEINAYTIKVFQIDQIAGCRSVSRIWRN